MLVAADVVLDRHLRVGVAEQLGGEVDAACSLTAVATVPRNMCGVTPSLPASPRDLAELAAGVRRRERCALPAAEHQGVERVVPHNRHPAAQRLGCEGGSRPDSRTANIARAGGILRRDRAVRDKSDAPRRFAT